MATNLTPFFLSFGDLHTKRVYEREKKIYYAKIMPVVAVVTL
jgi:hypothetical protein